jgi:UDP-N-acetylglucosamine 2-epimerase (non-hydrolysing)
MTRPRVMTILGTRPDIIKLSRVIAELDTVAEHLLVHTGQNFAYELNEVFFKDLEVRKPDHFLGAAGEGYAQTIAQVIERADEIIAREKPEAVLILGDTNSSLSVIPAKRRHVPIFHMEAGNRCYDQRVPEELNRKIVDHLSDINLTFSEHARRYLLAEGLRPETVIKIGSPMKEVLSYYRAKSERSDVLQRLGLKPQGFLLASAHREENVDDPARLELLFNGLRAVAEAFDRPVLFSTHPRTQKRLDALGVESDDRIRFAQAFGFLDYIKLQQSAFCVISDSGTITEESSILGFSAVTPREAHERPEGMDVGTLVMSGIRPERLVQAVDLVTRQQANGRVSRLPPDYDVDDVSRTVARIVLSYIDYVNRTVWFK